jgi:hypothetical protein
MSGHSRRYRPPRRVRLGRAISCGDRRPVDPAHRINRRFMIVPSALPSGGHAEQLDEQARNFRACSLKWRT